MNHQFFTLLLLCYVGFVQAQPPEGSGPNLIPNPGFEEVKGRPPKDDIDGYKTFKYNIVGWHSPTLSTPDLKITLPHEIKKAKRERKPIDVPHSGYKMVAIHTRNPLSERSDTYREYVEIRLDKTLKKGAEYYYEFWVCRAVQSKYVTNNIGFALSPSPVVNDGTWKPLTHITPDVNVDEVINKDKREWVKYSGTIKSANRSDFIVFGNFLDNEKTIMIEGSKDPEGDFERAYYLIDDVALHELNWKPEPPAAPKPKIEVGTVIKLDRIFFVTAKWDLLPESNEQLQEVIDLLNEYPDMEIEIHGHTDSRGDDNYNLNLSKNRAKSVYKYLIDTGGIDANRLKYKGFGEKKPVADNNTSEGRQLNRRVEFTVTKVGEENVEVEYDTDVKPYTDDE